jgi:hypothetical protein
MVPVDDLKKVTDAVNAHTQTVGVYPESLKQQLRDQLPLFGAQRLTRLVRPAACNNACSQPTRPPPTRETLRSVSHVTLRGHPLSDEAGEAGDDCAACRHRRGKVTG